MTITKDDIKILKAEVQLDTDDGGGMATSTEVIGNVSNNLFPDISELSSTYGRVELRKVYPGVVTDDTDTLFGSQFIFTQVPSDPKVNVCAFTTESWSDKRVDAQKRLETYLARGVITPWELLEIQLEGQLAIILMAPTKSSPPVAGSSLVLIQSEGDVTEYEHYIRIISVEAETRTFYRSNGSGETFELRVYTCEITDPLPRTFTGFSPQELNDGAVKTQKGRTRVRETRIADAAKYYSAKKLARPAALGAATLHVDSIYTDLVPSAQSESVMADIGVSGYKETMVKASETIVYDINLSVTAGLFVTLLGSGVTPGSLIISLPDGRELKDNSNNQVFIGDTQVGTIQYDQGTVTWVPTLFNYTGRATLQYESAFVNTQSDHSTFDPVTEVNRGLLWAKTLMPRPYRGSLRVTYVVSGKHYTIYDNGDGTLGSPSEGLGVGVIDYETGTLSLTLTSYPDVNSFILYQWGDKAIQLDTVSDQDARAYILLDVADKEQAFNGAYRLDTPLTITWEVPGDDGPVTKTATINRQTYEITGDAQGRLVDGDIEISPAKAVPRGTQFTLSYKGQFPPVGYTHLATIEDLGQSFTIDLSGVTEEIDPWSLKVNVPISMSDTEYVFMKPYDAVATRATITSMNLFVGASTGGNNFKVFMEANGVFGRQAVGTFNLNTKIMTITPFISFNGWKIETQTHRWAGYGGTSYSYETPVVRKRTLSNYSGLASAVEVKFSNMAAPPSMVNNPLPVIGYKLKVKSLPSYTLVPENVTFVMNGKTFTLDSNNRVLMLSGATYQAVGSYSGVLTDVLDVVIDGIDFSHSETLDVTWVRAGVLASDTPKSSFFFYTPIAPLRNGSFQLRVKRGDTYLLATADSNGDINSEFAYGKVDYETGFVRITLQTLLSNVTYAYAINYLRTRPELGDPDKYSDLVQVSDGLYNLRVPEWHQASNVSFNAIGLTYIPLSKDILGLDPVRLPANGKVPCFRKGEVIIVSDERVKEISEPLAGAVYSTGDTRISVFDLEDAIGNKLDVHTVNLSSGVMTLPSDFNAANYSLPLRMRWMVQDMLFVSDVQVSGILGLNKTLTHAYPEGAVVSSAIIMKDVVARAYNKFHLSSWNNVFSDQPSGNPISANYNTVFYPIQVTNRGALKERWAIVFTGAESFRCFGEFIGEIQGGNTQSDYKPLNPFTNTPYFTIKKEGWGTGWVNGNVMRFNTDAANFPVWIVRTTLQGQEFEGESSFMMQLRGDIDNET